MKVFVFSVRKIKRRVLGGAAVLSIIVALSLLVRFFSYAMENAYYDEVMNTSTWQVIIIDAGHGGEDSGASGVNGALEKDLNLEVSKAVGEELISRGYTVIYTRTTDKLLYKEEENVKGIRKISDLKNRCVIADGYPDAIFISIHMNHFGSSKYSGLQVYYSEGNEKSMKLAECIQHKVKSTLQTDNNRKIKSGKDLYILDNCKATSVIVECGFLSNKEECEKLSQKEYQKELSNSIVCGIIDYIEAQSN